MKKAIIIVGMVALIMSLVIAGDTARNKRSVTIDTTVEIDEAIFNDMGKATIEKKIIEEATAKLEDQQIKRVYSELEYEIFVLKQNKDYVGLKELTNYARNLNHHNAG